MLARFTPRLAAFLIAISLSLPAWALESSVTLFAAASTQPALDALAPAFEAEGMTVRMVYAASSTLARQIAAGAPADIYISANAAWMDDLEHQGLLVHATRSTIATNHLVLIAHAPFDPPLGAVPTAFGPDYPLERLLQGSRLAIADPDHVPAGMYAREALTALGLWQPVQDRLARTQNVTGALLLVARGEARLGIVYASDVARSAAVQALAPLPTDSHTPIVYPTAIIQGHDSRDVRRVFGLLNGPAGHNAFRAAGFGAAP